MTVQEQLLVVYLCRDDRARSGRREESKDVGRECQLVRHVTGPFSVSPVPVLRELGIGHRLDMSSKRVIVH